MNRKFQRSARRLSMSVGRPVAGDLAVVAAGRAERLVELLHQVDELEVRRRLERVVVLHQRQRHADHRQEPAARRVVDLLEVLGQRVGVRGTR